MLPDARIPPASGSLAASRRHPFKQPVDGLILHEDEHLLAIRKPPGINTHSAGPFAGEGIYEWLRRREPRWAELAIIQRLDKETSGVLLFSKSRRGNVSLTKQFSRRRVSKEYEFLTDRPPRESSFTVRSRIRKGRGRFESLGDDSEEGDDGLEAETVFRVLRQERDGGPWRVQAEPRTGRTHQIRIHAADSGMPILGDALYGGTPFARLCLHARALRLRHPATNAELEFISEPDFDAAPGDLLRASVVDRAATDAFRIVHGAADRRPGWYVDRLGGFLLASTGEGVADGAVPDWLMALARSTAARGVAVRRLDRHVRGSVPGSASPRLVSGEAGDGEFEVRENGLRFRLSFTEGYSCGLFLDQRDNRRRLLTHWIGPGFAVRDAGLAGAEVLNVFAYTCAFSVAAAAGGARTTSLDLSRKYLDWGRRNFEANGLDPAAHDFIFGDAFDWFRRLAKKGRLFDVVLLDPPTFSQSKEHGVFRAESDYGELVRASAAVLKPGGVLFASTNAARLEPEAFLTMVRGGLIDAGRTVTKELFVPQPPDFPTCREEPGYLKTVWVRV